MLSIWETETEIWLERNRYNFFETLCPKIVVKKSPDSYASIHISLFVRIKKYWQTLYYFNMLYLHNEKFKKNKIFNIHVSSSRSIFIIFILSFSCMKARATFWLCFYTINGDHLLFLHPNNCFTKTLFKLFK